MLTPGQFNTLTVLRKVEFGLFLDGEELGEILLPRKQVPEGLVVGERVEVFLYHDSEDRLIATRIMPKAVVGECAYLRVVAVDRIGAFLDWGLPKDLLVPFSEQQKPMKKGYSYVVHLYIDDLSGRIAASSRLEDHLNGDIDIYRPGQAVELQIYGRSDLGFKAVINNSHLGQLYESETFHRLHFGEKLPGYIKTLRTDGKIDLSLYAPAYKARHGLAETVIEHLREHGGVSSLTDRTPPEKIYEVFGVSKATYKKTLGLLYKNRRIMIERHRITLLDEPKTGG